MNAGRIRFGSDLVGNADRALEEQAEHDPSVITRRDGVVEDRPPIVQKTYQSGIGGLIDVQG